MKMGIIGAGGIARKMAGTIREMANVERTAIAARDFGRAQAFAKEFGFDRAYGSYSIHWSKIAGIYAIIKQTDEKSKKLDSAEAITEHPTGI